MKKFKKMFAVLTAVLMLLCMLPVGVFAEDDIPVDEAHFPDFHFRAYVFENCDTDGSGALSPEEIAAVTSINVYGEGIANLTGIEYFTALTEFDCGGNQLTSLDVSNNTALTELHCENNQLTSLDVSNNTALAEFFCYGNQLTNLNVSKNTALTLLECSWNQLTDLDVSVNTALWYLHCYDNQLTELDVSNNTALKSLNCSENQLTNLNVNGVAALEYLYCDGNQLTQLDVSNNTALTQLSCGESQLTELDVSNNTVLEELYCNSNQLMQLDVSNNIALKILKCNNNRLTSLDLSSNTQLHNWNDETLEGFICDDNQYKISSNPFNLSELPGNFDVTKATNWQGGSVSGSILTFDEGSETATYTYDCGNSLSTEFKLLSPDYVETAPGDYDGDGEVNVQDAIMILRSAMNLISGETPAAADVDGDGKISVQDAILALRMAMGLIEPDPNKPVVFHDPTFEAAFREKYGYAADENITMSIILDYTVLELPDYSLVDITDVTMFKNLTDLNLCWNYISNINPLAGLTKLTRLDLDGNGIKDEFADVLSGLTKLTDLSLACNCFSNLTPLAGLTELTKLDLCANEIVDISPLAGLTNLTTLILFQNQISDISPLSELTNLTELYLHNNEISSLNALSELTNLRLLDLRGNSLTSETDVSPLFNLTSLETLLIIGGNNLTQAQIDALHEHLPNTNIPDYPAPPYVG